MLTERDHARAALRLTADLRVMDENQRAATQAGRIMDALQRELDARAVWAEINRPRPRRHGAHTERSE